MSEVDRERFARVGEIDEALRRIASDRYPLPFTQEEYESRLQRCREAMAATNIDLLYVTWPEGHCYLHGYEVSWLRANSARKWFPYAATAIHVDHDRLIFLGGEYAVLLRRRIAGRFSEAACTRQPDMKCSPPEISPLPRLTCSRAQAG